MDLYLEKLEAAPKPDVVDEEKMTTDILNLLVTGCPADYECKGVKTGEDLSKPHVIAIAQANQGVECHALASKIYDGIIKESTEIKAKRPTEYATQTAFVAALEEKADVLSAATALAKLKSYCEVTTWTDLKALYPTPEVVKEVVEKV